MAMQAWKWRLPHVPTYLHHSLQAAPRAARGSEIKPANRRPGMLPSPIVMCIQTPV